MVCVKNVKIHSHEKGLLFKDKEFLGILNPGRHWFVDPLGKIRVDVVSQRDPWLRHSELDLVVKAGLSEDEATVLDLNDHERALVWIDGRFAAVLGPGQYALWRRFRKVRTELIDARTMRFEHRELNRIVQSSGAAELLESYVVEEGFAGVLFRDGEYVQTCRPGRYLFWKDAGKIRLVPVDLRETLLDISGQEILTADKVTLRLNAAVTYRVADPRKAVCGVEDHVQALYREAQLALRALIGGCTLDALLGDREGLSGKLEDRLRKRAAGFGLEVVTLGIRDLILPGDMKDLLNKVIEAQKAAEANLIVRREETAAMRSQANTARLLENNPVLMRLRELEVLEKIAGSSELKLVLGEKGLTDRLVTML
ncbi:flotillin band_7_stomatin-like domain protein [Syntrophotalea carbinolica DSM 2380]|uniref:Flotillin band_7_stomatin-like domain protein n=1 Tax=Syntrophotalea carbinolica (strain DSM 2380 / NBRC 103641 / GraBd1) TaxID=338963 RepID=Q3A0N5_SYNC1|nr:slipin family protein [Syntrophotalea carbinolica]ABA90072.1 flotillin band_7_stomatin-like domain protein [Syntrophotalea carbinolica DSM 2380]